MLNLDDDLEFIFFGGKGGVGKTTSAAATAIHLARLKSDERILVVTTDPARALHRSFDLQVGDSPTLIEGFDNLWGMEINAEKEYQQHLEEHKLELLEVAYRSSVVLDTKDAWNITQQSTPGIDEVMALKKMVDFHDSGRFDLIVVDTAPTGHTLNLLKNMSKGVKQADLWIEAQYRHRMVEGAFGMVSRKRRYKRHLKRQSIYRRYKKDEIDEFLDKQKRDALLVRKMLTDGRRTEFIAVTIPEAMGILETFDLLGTLKKLHVNNRQIIFNMVNLHADESDCDFCRARRRKEETYIEELMEKFPYHNIIQMPVFDHEIRGLDSLIEFGKILFREHDRINPAPTPYPLEPIKSNSENHRLKGPSSDMSNILGDEVNFVLFGGKGGVGKTTCAVATAIHLVKLRLNKRILVVSTDPAHSLADSFDLRVGEMPTLIEGYSNLFGMEINAEKEWTIFKEEWQEVMDEAFGSLGRSSQRIQISMDHEQKLFREMLDLAPSGVDEIMAIIRIQELLESGEFGCIVLDTAPTGHLLRLLEMPQIMDEWISTLLSIQKKYQRITDLRRLAVMLLERKRDVRKLIMTLINFNKTKFVAVSIPEAMGMLETLETLKTLKELMLRCENIVINNIMPQNDCPFCAMKRKEQQKYVEEYYEKFPGYRIARVPLFPHEIRGIDKLEQFADILYANAA